MAPREPFSPTPADAPAPDAPAVSEEQAPAEKPSKVTLTVTTPFTDNFVLHIDKKPVTITNRGTEVPADQVDAILAAAKESGVKIKKTEN